MEVYIFSQDDRLLNVITESTGLRFKYKMKI